MHNRVRSIWHAAFGFKVPLAALVRMRAADEMPARKVVRSILAPPAIAKITASRGRFEPSEYRIRHPGEDFERVALENELSVA